MIKSAWLPAIAYCVCSSTVAQQVMLSPGTLVLDEGRRAGVVLVGTPGSEPASFSVTNAYYVQDANGQLFAANPASAANDASGFVRVGPRRFSAAPGQGQQVRVAVRPPVDLAPGEYRMHLLVANAGQQSAQPAEAQLERPADALSFVIPIRVARGVRVLYRHKVKPMGGRLESIQFHRDGDNLSFEFKVLRLGATSLVGRYRLFALDKANNRHDIGPETGISIYAELDHRTITGKETAAGVPADALICVRLIPDDPGNKDLEPVESCSR